MTALRDTWVAYETRKVQHKTPPTKGHTVESCDHAPPGSLEWHTHPHEGIASKLEHPLLRPSSQCDPVGQAAQRGLTMLPRPSRTVTGFLGAAISRTRAPRNHGAGPSGSQLLTGGGVGRKTDWFTVPAYRPPMVACFLGHVQRPQAGRHTFPHPLPHAPTHRPHPHCSPAFPQMATKRLMIEMNALRKKPPQYIRVSAVTLSSTPL